WHYRPFREDKRCTHDSCELLKRDLPMSSIAGHGTRVGIVILACARLAIAEPEPNTVVLWNQAALQAVRDGTLGPPMVARALAIMHTCMYDAWAAYDEKAIGTQLGGSLRT